MFPRARATFNSPELATLAWGFFELENLLGGEEYQCALPSNNEWDVELFSSRTRSIDVTLTRPVESVSDISGKVMRSAAFIVSCKVDVFGTVEELEYSFTMLDEDGIELGVDDYMLDVVPALQPEEEARFEEITANFYPEPLPSEFIEVLRASELTV
jgi:hypothetical protein